MKATSDSLWAAGQQDIQDKGAVGVRVLSREETYGKSKMESTKREFRKETT
jgi:hypothetical protein